jgi:CO/xanthine dehydrogenase FAD-binding subunit
VSDAIAMVPEQVEPLDDTRGSAAYKREMARIWTARAFARLAR